MAADSTLPGRYHFVNHATSSSLGYAKWHEIGVYPDDSVKIKTPSGPQGTVTERRWDYTRDDVPEMEVRLTIGL